MGVNLIPQGVRIPLFILCGVVKMDKSIYDPSQQEKTQTLFVVICVFFSTCLVLSNVTLKVFYFPWFPNFPMTSGILTYPLTFLVTDFVSEIYGPKKARLMVVIGFMMNLLMILYTQGVLLLPSHPSWFVEGNRFGFSTVSDYQTAYSAIFSVNGLIFLGSMVAYLVAQFLDIKIFCLLKKKSKNRHLWIRNNVSTCFSQLIDTLIMNAIVFMWGLHLNLSSCLTILFSEYLYKVIFALLDTPLIYFFVHLFRRRFQNYEYLEAA